MRPRLQHYLPWAFIGGPGVVVQKNGLLQKTYEYRGPDLDCVDISLAEHHTSELSNTIMRLGTGWALFFEAQRSQIREYPITDINNVAAKKIDDERKEHYTAPQKHYESIYYFTIVYEPPTDLSKKATQAIGVNISAEVEIKEFAARADDIAGILSGLAIVRALNDVETMAYLHSTISTSWHNFAVPSRAIHLDYALADSGVAVFSKSLKLGEKHLMVISFLDYPSETFAGILNELNTCAIELRYVSRYICLSKEDAKKRIEAYGRKYFAGRVSFSRFLKNSFSETGETGGRLDVGNMALEEQVDHAQISLAKDENGFGLATNTIIIMDDEFERLVEKSRIIKKIIQSAGFAAKNETVNALQAWRGSLPGDVYSNIRRPLISTANIAHIVPLTSVWTGSRINNHLEKISGIGTPHAVTSTHTKTPFYLNLNLENGDVGHTFIAGPTGAGKSTLLGFLAVQWLKYPGGKVVICDKDHSAYHLTEQVGGSYFEPGSSEGQVFQPLALLENESDLIWATEFIELLLDIQLVKIVPSIRKAINEALKGLQGIQRQQRTISTLSQMIQYEDNTIRDALRPYRVDGVYGSIFDADKTTIDVDSFWLMFELSQLMDMGRSVILPALMVLFHIMEKEVFRGQPTMLILDEAWLFLSHEYFVKTIKNWLKTLRKKNVFVVFATQEVTDASQSSISSTIIQQTPTKIFLPDPQAESASLIDMYRSIGLTDSEIQALANCVPKQDYLYKSTDGVRVFQLDLGPVALDAITKKKETEIIEETRPLMTTAVKGLS